jgi:hypothetical protein
MVTSFTAKCVRGLEKLSAAMDVLASSIQIALHRITPLDWRMIATRIPGIALNALKTLRAYLA